MKSPISPVCLDFHQNRRFWSLEIADFRRLAIYRQAQIRIASRMSKIADLATYRQKWQHCSIVRACAGANTPNCYPEGERNV